jgi:hypothetical protein
VDGHSKGDDNRRGREEQPAEPGLGQPQTAEEQRVAAWLHKKVVTPKGGPGVEIKLEGV